MAKSSTQRLSKWASQVVRAPSRHLCWTRRFRRYCEMGALETLGAQLNFEEGALALLRHGVRVPLRVNAMGHYVVSVVELGRGPNVAASYFE